MPLTVARDRLVRVGETVGRTLRFSREDIAAFARISFDQNPLHVDTQAAQRARFGEVIASGQHTAAVLMGLLATHFSRSDDGLAREMLCLNMNFAFKGPVFADQALTLQWRVATVEWNAKLEGALAHLDGSAAVLRGQPAVVARGTILVREQQHATR
jgi:acyl dehydratase